MLLRKRQWLPRPLPADKVLATSGDFSFIMRPCYENVGTTDIARICERRKPRLKKTGFISKLKGGQSAAFLDFWPCRPYTPESNEKIVKNRDDMTETGRIRSIWA